MAQDAGVGETGKPNFVRSTKIANVLCLWKGGTPSVQLYISIQKMNANFSLLNIVGNSLRLRNVKASLRTNIPFWEEQLKPSPFVLNVLKRGYLLPLTQVPRSFHAKNNQSAYRHVAFVGEAIEKLLRNRFVDELSRPLHCCNPLTVADKGKLRLVLDLRHVNAYINLQKFKCENLRTVAELFYENDFFIRFDLTSGYHHIDIHPEHYKYLGFHWRFEGNITRLQYSLSVCHQQATCSPKCCDRSLNAGGGGGRY